MCAAEYARFEFNYINYKYYLEALPAHAYTQWVHSIYSNMSIIIHPQIEPHEVVVAAVDLLCIINVRQSDFYQLILNVAAAAVSPRAAHEPIRHHTKSAPNQRRPNYGPIIQSVMMLCCPTTYYTYYTRASTSAKCKI